METESIPAPAGSRFLTRIIHIIGLMVVLLTAFSYAFVPLRESQDEWWHLKAGQWMLEHRQLPVYDIFTYTGENLRWHNHEWLSQILFYSIFDAAGKIGFGSVQGLVLFKALIYVLTIGLVVVLARLRGAPFAAALLLGFAAAEISRRTIYPRPPIFSYVLMALFLIHLYRWKQGKVRDRWLWVLPLLTVVWGNLHGMVLLAVVITGGFFAGELLERLWAWWREKRPPGLLRSLVTDHKMVLLGFVTFATIMACMAQPTTYHIFTLGRKFTADPLLKDQIAEMRPAPFFLIWGAKGQWAFVPGFFTFWFAAAVLPVVLLLLRGRFCCGADYVLAAFFWYQAVLHWRLLPLFAIGCAAPAACLAYQMAQRFSDRTRRLADVLLSLSVVGLGVCFVFFVDEHQTFFQRNRDLVRGKTMSAESYPAPLMDFIIRADLPDRMFSESNYCGYAMWRLSPEHHKLFTDNRFDLFGSTYWAEEAVTLNAIPRDESRLGRGWEDILDQYGVNFIVIHNDQPLHQALRVSGKWLQVYYYWPPGNRSAVGIYSVWIRNTPSNAPAIERSRAEFAKDNPGKPSPGELDLMMDSLQGRIPVANNETTSPVSNPAKQDWRLP